MKIESGKYYKTRDGRKAFVAHAGSPFPSADSRSQVIGYISGESRSFSWTRNGRFVNDVVDSGYDLVAEWQEPVSETVWIHLVRYPDGAIGVQPNCASIPADYFGSSTLLARKQITLTEGEGMSQIQEFNPC